MAVLTVGYKGGDGVMLTGNVFSRATRLLNIDAISTDADMLFEIVTAMRIDTDDQDVLAGRAANLLVSAKLRAERRDRFVRQFKKAFP